MRVLLWSLLVLGVQGWPSEAPFWPKYPTRKLQVLDGQWEFGFAENVDIASVDPSMALTPNTTTVPSVFDNAMPGIPGRRGTAFYRTTINAFASGSRGMISFAACGFYCKVWVDGVLLGDHRSGGYSMFWFDLPQGTPGTPKELFVLSDNRFNVSTATVYTGGDFWHFAGISRSVVVHEIPSTPTSLMRVDVTPTDLSGTIKMKFVATRFSAVSSKPCFTLDWGGKVDSVCVAFNGTEGTTTVDMPCKPTGTCKLWSFDSPYLHMLNITIGADTISTRFGIRIISTKTVQVNDPPVTEVTRITINGEVVKLKGYNRHTMYPDTGLAVTLDEHKQDMQLIKEIGANMVRGAHYPQDQRWLDLCDENGIGMWVECLGPGVSASDIQSKDFMGQQLKQAREMVEASFNNPSVLMWGFFNEGPTTDQTSCVDGYKVMADSIRARDPSRLVTWADDHTSSSLCLPYADVVSFNNYPAWYGSGGPETCAPYWDGKAKWVAQNFDKPFMISETGAGGIYEWPNNASTVKWGQGYQSAVVSADVTFALNSDLVSSLTLWQFMDIKANVQDTIKCGQCDYLPGVTPPTCGYITDACNRPGGENHKGAVDFWRRKKQVFSVVQKLYTSHTDEI